MSEKTTSSFIMNDLSPYSPIDTVDTTTYDWKLRVRVQSFWKSLSREKQEFWGVNMLLIDDSNGRVHAFANSKYCGDLLKEIKEGEIYVISNFKVKDYLGDEKYRAVRSKKHIFFTPHTLFKKATDVGLPIELYAFDLFHYDAIEKLADDNRFLIDMAGKVINVQDLIKIKKNDEEKTLFKFQISNGSSTVHVTFFDQFGELAEKDFGNADRRNLYVIISCAKVGRYEGLPHLSNYPATRVYINPKHYCINELKRRWKCTGCDLELELEHGKFICSRPNGCGRIIPYPDKRFRLCTLCSDESGSVAIIFPDHEITKLIDKTVIDLHADCSDEAEEEKFPEILNMFLKQKYTINLSINLENVEKGSTVFHAKEILQAQEKGDSFDPNSATVVEIGDISLVNESGTEQNANETPNTEKSTNMKTRPRNISESLAFNPTDASVSPLVKKIKVEKQVKTMASNHYTAVEKLKPGVDQYKIKVRVIRLWRGATKSGEEFKSFNVIVIDQKEFQFIRFVGRVYSIKNFDVQIYKQTEKFRVLRNATQLVFNQDTICQQLADDGVTIPANAFDFYDHSQLEELSKQTTYLADVVGIIKDYDNIRDLTNRHGQSQRQAKFYITDGNSNISVTFWDNFGQNFDKLMKSGLEKPVIIIISGCRVGKWNGEIDISNNTATTVYLNYKHHSVVTLRKLLTNPEFAKKALGKPKVKSMAMATVKELENLGKDDIEGFFMAHVKITKIDETFSWFYNACTSCDMEVTVGNPCPICEACNRYVPYPQKKFKIHVVAEDQTGQMPVVLGDREVRAITGRRASDFADQIFSVQAFPGCVLGITDKEYSIVIQIREANVLNKFKYYWATNICRGFVKLPAEADEGASSSRAPTSQLRFKENIHTNMAEIPYQMISNLRPQITTAWRLKVRVTRIWQAITQQGDTVGINCIFVDELGGRIRAWIAAANMNQLQGLITEGETYNVHNFVVRQYGAMQTERCFENDFFIQLYHMTNIFVAEDVDYIQRHVFQFTNLSAIIDAARESNFLIDVVGVLQQVQPMTSYRNKYNQLKNSIQFTINDMNVKARMIQGEVKLTNYPATRFFINLHHEAVEDLRDALSVNRLNGTDWQIGVSIDVRK
uniref:Uncharacterized protein n=1 Tax=Daucus carota subsp. sativus TaxID=79200 RepID=A0A165A0B4_DAUCS